MSFTDIIFGYFLQIRPMQRMGMEANFY